MNIFLDTSAFLAVLDADNRNHRKARALWERVLREEDVLVVTNYILLETHALVQNRLGMEAVRDFAAYISPLLEVVWVDESLHQRGLSAFLSANRRKLSLVDCISFEVARELAIPRIFTFDKHFTEQGFHCLPEP